MGAVGSGREEHREGSGFCINTANPPQAFTSLLLPPEQLVFVSSLRELPSRRGAQGEVDLRAQLDVFSRLARSPSSTQLAQDEHPPSLCKSSATSLVHPL